TSFDKWPGGKRNHDLLVYAHAVGGCTVVGVEAKADETFGQTVAAYHRAVKKRVQGPLPTNADKRLEQLTRKIAGSTLAEQPELGNLRYQLFAGVAGALAAAADAQQA